MHGPLRYFCHVSAHSLCNLAAGKSSAGKTAAAAKGGKNSGKVRALGILLVLSAVLVSPDPMIVNRMCLHCKVDRLAVSGAVCFPCTVTLNFVQTCSATIACWVGCASQAVLALPVSCSVLCYISQVE